MNVRGPGRKRGQAVVLGTILVFAVLVLSLALYQTNLVPQQNRAVEFATYQEANADMVGLHGAVVQAADGDTQAGVSVRTGVDYPVRPFARNPPPTAGNLRVVDDGALVLDNAVSTDAEAADYWNGDASRATFTTRRVVFEPSYSGLDVTPVTVTGALAYRNPGDGDATFLTEQTLVRGTRLSLVTIQGDLGLASSRATLSVEPVSTGGSQSVVAGPDDPDGDGDPELTLRVPTDLSAAEWTELLDGEPNVEAVTGAGASAVEIRLRGVDTNDRPIVYDLRLSSVEIRERNDDSVVPGPAPVYAVSATGDGASITNRQTSPVTVRVHDAYGNPVPGVDVNFVVSPAGTGSVSATLVRTDTDGLATTTFDPADDGDGTVTVSAECLTCIGGVDAAQGTFEVQVSPGPDAAVRPPELVITDIARPGAHEFNVTVDVSDADGDLQTVRFRLYDPVDSGNTPLVGPVTVDDADLAEDRDTVTVTLSVLAGDRRGSYHLLVEVIDDEGRVDSDSTILFPGG